MFEPVSSRVNFPELEKSTLAWWQKQGIFEKSLEARKEGPRFVLYEGPPTANGNPGIHHVLARAFKDVIARYRVMKGCYAPRIAGWDTHGLPVELEVEKQLGFSGKTQIEEYGIDKFNRKCRESVFKYLKEWNELTERIGYWLDLEHPYITMSSTYIESVWWAIRRMWDKGLVYQGYKVTPHCPRCGTSLSSHEVAQGYKEDTEDPSVYIKFLLVQSTGHGDEADEKLFKLINNRNTYLLAWTTTPWTLPGNTALAVAPDAEYVVVKNDDEYLILALALVEQVGLGDCEIILRLKGSDLATIDGVNYKPLYNPHDFNVERLQLEYINEAGVLGAPRLVRQQPRKPLYYKVITADFVTMEDGTGIVHIAPAFGEVDFQIGMHPDYCLNFVQHVDLQGNVIGTLPGAGKFVKKADEDIIDDLKERGLLYKAGTIKHTYPFCWRCDTPLLYYAKQTWYIRTTAMKDKLIAGNEEISWHPEHIKYGRFGDWLQNNVDWAFSRERYWGTPLPVWRCEACGNFECVGGLDELRGKDGLAGLEEPLDLHRPYVDDITFKCQCGGAMKRVPEVIDCWFDSGAMPIAQSHYPYENETLLEDGRFPADYICEAVDQTRGWFYSLHAIATLLFERPSYRHVICLGHILDANGEKMSKARKNVVQPAAIIDKYGADALRWYLFTAQPLGNPYRFAESQVAEISRRFLSTLWNVYSFFVLYANIDEYNPNVAKTPPPESELDKWITSELNQLVAEVDAALDGYNPIEAGRKIERFVDGLSNWYVRRSRRRFWKSENDADKLSAYGTLYSCLVTLAKLLAPLAPFVAEELYRNLVKSVAPDAPESVHLADFPAADTSVIDKELGDAHRLAMKVCSLGRAARSKAGIKVRQPLAEISVGVGSEREKRALETVETLVLDELNVKGMAVGSVEEITALESEPGYVVNSEAGAVIAIYTLLNQTLEAEGMAREIVHRVQTMRRNAGYEIADHIVLYYEGDAVFIQPVSSFADYIMQETLAKEMEEGLPEDVDATESYKYEGFVLRLGVKKAA